jgi:hypothetical protein
MLLEAVPESDCLLLQAQLQAQQQPQPQQQQLQPQPQQQQLQHSFASSLPPPGRPQTLNPKS